MGINIGLTGGMGCGKSTALELFREAGIEVIETDALVREMLSTDRTLQKEIVEAFGSAVLGAEGKVDRAALGRTVFGNSRNLRVLERLVHPRVRDKWMGQLRENHSVLVIEIPLLFENSLEKLFTQTVCVSSTPEIQRDRLLRRGLDETQIKQRLDRQLPLEEKMRRADILLHNNGSLEHLRDQVFLVIKALGSGCVRSL
jgi:dephospho-CoA kinase